MTDDGNENGNDSYTSPYSSPSNPTSSSSSSSPSSLSHFWSSSANSASPSISSIKHRLPHFVSPSLRIQRVNQLDSELLDNELITILLDPFKSALANIRSNLPNQIEPELLLFFRLALFKLSIVDRGATYGAMLQNLRYRNEWLHRKGLQSTYKDAPLSRIQLLFYPVLTILLPYGNSRLERYMTSLSFSQQSPDSLRSRVWNLLERIHKLYGLLALVNFGVFLADGKFRTLTDRILGMRLIYNQRIMNRNVSFEFLNRQLVWHAFTEFLLFLLPLIKPRRLMKRLLRLPTHPRFLNLLLYILPSTVTNSFGLYRDAVTLKPRFDANSSKVFRTLRLNRMISGRGKSELEEDDGRGEYDWLPSEVCAICYQEKEKENGNRGKKMIRERIRNGLPNSDPLDPSSGSLINPNRDSSNINNSGSDRSGNRIESIRQNAIDSSNSSTTSSSTSSTSSTAVAAVAAASRNGKSSNEDSTSSSSQYSPSGIPYSLTRINVPYEALPCKHIYCYVCISKQLLSEEVGEDLLDDRDGNGGWDCLRCNMKVKEARRWEGGVVEGEGIQARKVDGIEDQNQGGENDGKDIDGEGEGEEEEDLLFDDQDEEVLESRKSKFGIGQEQKHKAEAESQIESSSSNRSRK